MEIKKRISETSDEKRPLKKEANIGLIDTILNRIGFGRYQQLVLLVGGLGLLGDGAEMTAISIVAFVLEDEWSLSTLQLGLLTGSIFLGVGLGYLWSGHYTNRYGRVQLFRLSFVIISVSGFASALAPEFWSLLCFRTLAGFGVGTSLPISITYVIENLPSQNRGIFFLIFELFFIVGQILVVSWTLLFIPHLEGDNWRLLFACVAVPPALGFGLSFCGLKDSPIFLLTNAMPEQCIESLNHISNTNKSEPLTSEEQENINQIQVNNKQASPLIVLFDENHLGTTLKFVALYTVILNGYYGFLYMLPNTLEEQHSSDFYILMGLLIAILMELPCCIAALLLMELECLGRKGTLRITLGLSAGLCMAASIVAEFAENYVLLLGAICGMAMANLLLLHPYCSETFNTEVRAMSLALTNSVARAFNLGAPLLFITLSREDSWTPLALLTVLYSSALLLSFFLPKDTQGQALDTVIKNY